MSRHLAAWVAALPVLLFAVAACGGEPSTGDGIASANGGGSATSSPTPSPTGNPLKFAQCMREHGVDMADPESNGKGGAVRIRANAKNKAKLDAASKACQRYAPAAAGKLSQGPSKEDQARLLDFAKCMREHGIDMADPQFNGSGGGVMLPGNITPDDPKLKAAQKACQSRLPQQRGGNKTTNGGSAR